MLKYDLPLSSEEFCIGLFKANGAFFAIPILLLTNSVRMNKEMNSLDS